MKLYLSSFKLGSAADKLVSMTQGNRKTAVIFNALDFSEDAERKQAAINREMESLSKLGSSPIHSTSGCISARGSA